MLDKLEFSCLQDKRQTWVVTGAAGFIGSHLVETLLYNGQRVIGLDDLSSGSRTNLRYIEKMISTDTDGEFTFVEGDIRDSHVCNTVCQSVDYVLHHAAVGSVPLSFEKLVDVDSVNVGGFLNLVRAAADCGVKRLVYASSSAVYGDSHGGLNREDQLLTPCSPYAVGKYADELYAGVLGQHLGLEMTGLRYFNIYGTRQNPEGAYAAVIPRWINILKEGGKAEIYGDGNVVRDFCHVRDAVQANIRAAAIAGTETSGKVYNIASGKAVTLNRLFAILKKVMKTEQDPVYLPARSGDIMVSKANIEKASKFLEYEPTVDLETGLADLAEFSPLDS